MKSSNFSVFLFDIDLVINQLPPNKSKATQTNLAQKLTLKVPPRIFEQLILKTIIDFSANVKRKRYFHYCFQRTISPYVT